MNDTKITQALEDLAAESSPEPSRWLVIDRKIRRRHVFRVTTSVALSVLVVAGLLVAIRTATRDADFVAPPASGTPAAFRDEENNFQIRIPDGWIVDGYEQGVSVASISPPVPPGENGGFSVEVFTQFGVAYHDHTGFGTVPFTVVPNIDGASAVRWEERLPEAENRRVAYRIDWSKRRSQWASKICSGGHPCDAGSSTIAFLITAANDDQWKRYGAEAETMVKSLRTLDGVVPERWLEATIFTPWGRIDPGILYDRNTAVLVQFLDALASGSETSRVYEGDRLLPITGYRVVERIQDPTLGPRFRVEMREAKRSSSATFVIGSDLKVRVFGKGAPLAPPPTPGGTVAAGLTKDEFMGFLLRFLDARMNRDTFEFLLCCDATSREREKWYGYGEFDMIGYRVLERQDGSSQTQGFPYFIVEIVYEQGAERNWNGTVPTLQEFIVVGRQSGDLKITRWADEGTS